MNRKAILKHLKYIFQIILICLFFACENNLKDVYNNNQEESIDIVIGPNILFSRAGYLKAQILGDSLLVHRNYQTFINGITIYGFDTSQIKVYEIIGDSATIFPDINEAYIERNVRIVNYVKKDTIWCENLIFKYNKDSVYTQKPVHIKTLKENIYGSAMYSDVDMKNYSIIQPKGNVLVKESNE